MCTLATYLLLLAMQKPDTQYVGTWTLTMPWASKAERMKAKDEHRPAKEGRFKRELTLKKDGHFQMLSSTWSLGDKHPVQQVARGTWGNNERGIVLKGSYLVNGKKTGPFQSYVGIRSGFLMDPGPGLPWTRVGAKG